MALFPVFAVGLGSEISLLSTTITGPGRLFSGEFARAEIRNSILGMADDEFALADNTVTASDSTVAYTLSVPTEATESYPNDPDPIEIDNIQGDPMFEDPEGGDYHMQSGSPAIDTGDPFSPFDAEPDPNGCRLNMGAFGNTPDAAISTFGEGDIDTNGDGVGDLCQCGDVNGDGVMNNVDSILIKRADLGLSTGSSYDPALCDVNADGLCNNVDSVLIKRFDLGLSTGSSFRTICPPMP